MQSVQSRIANVLLRRINMKESILRKFETGVFRTKYSSPEPALKFLDGIDVGETLFDDCKVFELKPVGKQPTKTVLFLHGGAYLDSFVQQHWETLGFLIRIAGCRVVAPDYPLAPKFTYKETFDFMVPFYKDLISKYGSDDLFVMGDSAGGGLGLALVQKMSVEKEALPKQLILLSPWLDVSMTNPEIKDVDARDPLLGLPGLKLAADAYSGDTGMDNYLVSPIHGPLEGLCPVNLFIGTRDVLEPDCRKFRQKCQEAGVNLNYVEYKNMIHVWMILLMMPEAKKAIREIAQIITQ